MNTESSPPRWHLLTFANGRYRAARDRLIDSARTFGASSVHAHDPQTIRQYDWARSNRHVLRQKHGAGYWLWKPYLILEALRQIPAGDFLLYADAGTLLVSSPLALVSSCQSQDGILLFQVHGYLNDAYVKRDCFILMGCDTAPYWQAEQVNGAFLFLQHNDRTIAFVAEWAAWADSLGLITDEPNRLERPNLPGFIHHRHDQSILSLLAEKHGMKRLPDPSQWGEPHRRQDDGKFAPYPTVFDHHRQRTLSMRERLRMWLGARRHALFGPKNRNSR
ncbi:MAG: hypothetical protein H7A44_10695 [Opitutaceae bacterium]|nr:hypothetical protein [Opitutaceae bacterium]